MSYPIDKYRFYFDGNTTIAVANYSGKPVRGVAKLDPRDEYNRDIGMAIAAARCNAKIASKRAKRAKKKLNEALTNYFEARNILSDRFDYFENSRKAEFEANIALEDIHASDYIPD